MYSSLSRVRPESSGDKRVVMVSSALNESKLILSPTDGRTDGHEGVCSSSVHVLRMRMREF